MEGKRVVKGTAIGFLVAGPVGAAAGALFGSRDKKAPKTAKERAADSAGNAAAAILVVVFGLAYCAWSLLR